MLSLDFPSGIDRRFNRFGASRNERDVQLEKRFNRIGTLKPRLKGKEEPVAAANLPTAPNSLGLDIE